MDNTLIDFLDTIVPELPDGIQPVYCTLQRPPGDNTPWPPIDEEALLRRARRPQGRAFYISTMLAQQGSDDRWRNRQENFWALNMVVLDDVGTKVDPNKVPPTYVIESSQGNYQWGYVFEDPVQDRDLARRLVAAVYETELTDGGGKLVNKYVRLPVGINGKINGEGRNEFAVRLLSSDGPLYTPESLVEAFGLTLAEPAGEGAGEAPDMLLPAEDYRQVRDPVSGWLREKGLLLSDDGADWVGIECPWHLAHTNQGERQAGYSPLGRGGSPDHRAFHCFHDSCKERKTVDFLEWVHGQGGPRESVWDPVSPLVSRYVLLENGSEVADTWASAASKYPVTKLSDWRAAHKQVMPGRRRQFFCDLWQEHEDTVRCKGRVYDPTTGPLVPGEAGDLLFNTYRPVLHPPAMGVPEVYLAHIAWLLPDPGERALFHDWIAQKLQVPASRSYAVVLVADLREGEAGERYGTGRSVVGDILGAVFQAGVAKLDLQDLTGKGDSQAAYNDWADATQLAIVEETKEEAASWRIDLAAYEGLKKIIDPRPVPGVRVKPKYGRIYTTTLYCNFLLFTNHSNALQLPADDRRFCVLNCATGRRSFEEYKDLHRLLRDPLEIARIYHWYMARDIEQFDQVYPPMTPGKQRMIVQSKGALDEVWEHALAGLPGGVITRDRLKDACIAACEGDVEMAAAAKKMALARWRKLETFEAGWVLKHKGSNYRIRALRDPARMLELQAAGEFEALYQQLLMNL